MAQKILLVTGLSGLIGRRAAVPLLKAGYRLRGLSRDPVAAAEALPLPIEWFAPQELERALRGAEGVVHLAGEPVAGKRWSAKRKATIRSSRVEGTQTLVDAIAAMKTPPKVFVSASAVGIYGDTGEAELSDAQARPGRAPKAGGNTFLREVCEAWERAWSEGLPRRTRGVGLRIGMVLAQEGGALAELLPLFKLGVGGPLGGGKPWTPWIHVDDVVGLILHALKDPRARGIFNAVGPQSIRNTHFTRVLGALLGRPAFAPVPTFALRLLYGEMADIVLASQKVLPTKALKLGYRFKHATIESALAEELVFEGHTGVNVLDSYQWIPQPLEQVWPFFTDAKNLEALTPDFLNFKVLTQDTRNLHPGSLLDYKLRVHGVPLRWRTLIQVWQPEGPAPHFVDLQLKGPYGLWHHTHRFETLAGGTLMRDTVRFQLPGAWFGQWGEAWVKKDVAGIFKHRVSAVKKRF